MCRIKIFFCFVNEFILLKVQKVEVLLLLLCIVAWLYTNVGQNCSFSLDHYFK